ncbi:MAG: GTPase Era [Micrococcales bacterium]|nr:GTPase Era [Micrococcales bacterium]
MTSHSVGEHLSGFVAIVGRPNTGKSTLVNAMVGTKVAITSSKPQTTRRTLRGIVRRPGLELVLVDTPGVHRPRTLLGERLNDAVAEAVTDVDAIIVCLPADEGVGPGDRHILASLPRGVPVVAAVTKADLVPRRNQLAERLVEVDATANWTAIVPVSATSGFQVEELVQAVGEHMPPGPDFFPDGEASDAPLEVALAEIIREAALEDLRDEMPHSLAVVVEEVDDEGRAVIVRATVFVERESQKGIVIGKGGAQLRRVQGRARRAMVELLGRPARLDLHVKVAKDWQRDPKLLGRLGL